MATFEEDSVVLVELSKNGTHLPKLLFGAWFPRHPLTVEARATSVSIVLGTLACFALYYAVSSRLRKYKSTKNLQRFSNVKVTKILVHPIKVSLPILSTPPALRSNSQNIFRAVEELPYWNQDTTIPV